MANFNRQCFFYTENRFEPRNSLKASMPWKNTRIYMNRMVVSEEDQYEISGFYSINGPSIKNNQRKKGKFKNIYQRENFQEQIDKLSAASGTIHLFISGINLTKRFNWITVMGSKYSMRIPPSCESIDQYSSVLSLGNHKPYKRQ